jgi:hypothetical protein
MSRHLQTMVAGEVGETVGCFEIPIVFQRLHGLRLHAVVGSKDLEMTFYQSCVLRIGKRLGTRSRAYQKPPAESLLQ